MDRARAPDNGNNCGWQSVRKWRAESRLSVGGGDELVDIGYIARCGWSMDVVCLATQSVLFRFQRFPTCTAQYVEIVIVEHGLAIIECQTLCPTAGSVADLCKADLTRVLSDCTLIRTAFPTLPLHPHQHVLSTQGSSQSAPRSPAFKDR